MTVKTWSEQERRDLYKNSIKHWGANAQIDMLIEELGEAIVAVQKYTKRKDTLENYDHMAEELCDVLFMIEEIMYHYDQVGHPGVENKFSFIVRNWFRFKLDRTEKRLEESIKARK